MDDVKVKEGCKKILSFLRVGKRLDIKLTPLLLNANYLQTLKGEEYESRWRIWSSTIPLNRRDHSLPNIDLSSPPTFNLK